MSGPCIVGVQSCGCVTYANARPDDLDREDHKAIGQIIAEGGSVLHTTTDEARAMPHFLVSECPHDPKGWEPEPYVDPAERISFRRTYHKATMVQRGWSRIGEVRSEGRGRWMATPGYFFPSDESPRLGPFKTRAEAADALASHVPAVAA